MRDANKVLLHLENLGINCILLFEIKPDKLDS